MAVNIGDLTNKPAPEDTDLIELDTGSASFNTSKQQFLAGIQGEVDNKVSLTGDTMVGDLVFPDDVQVTLGDGTNTGRVLFNTAQNQFAVSDALGLRGFAVAFTTNTVTLSNFSPGGTLQFATFDSDFVLSPGGAGDLRIVSGAEMIWDDNPAGAQTPRGRIWYGDAGQPTGNSFNFTNPAGNVGFNVHDNNSIYIGGGGGTSVSVAAGDNVQLTAGQQLNISAAGGTSFNTGDVNVANTLTGPTIEGKLDREVTKTTVDAFTTGQVGVLTDPGVVLADASTEATARGQVLIALENIGAGQTGRFAFLGLVAQPNVSAPGRYYLTTTPGTISTARPVGSGEVVRVVGEQDDPGIINLIPDSTIIVLL